jgi:hypothetical protein
VTGYVYFTEADIRNATRFLGVTKAAFEKQYIYRTAHQRRMRKPKGTAQCHFLKDGGCSIHPVKPVQCRLFPFWPELVGDRKQWRQTASFCPGIGKGELIQIGAALEQASEMMTAYPGFY